LFDRVLAYGLKSGSLTVSYANGMTRRFGDGTGPDVRIRVASSTASTKLAFDPDLYLGECYMDGSLSMEKGTIYDLLDLAIRNFRPRLSPPLHRLLYRARIAAKRSHQFNPASVARQNVAHHYDLSGKLYDLFLDADRQYSCAYFETTGQSLEDAQRAKKRHLAAKLAIKPGMRVLDIGSGWGGLGLYLAEVCGADVTGVTLSEEQHRLSSGRLSQRGLGGKARFLLQDYRDLEGPFDRIVSVGMFEHVGVGHFEEFFAACARLLKPDGVAVLHSINRSDGPGATSAWIKKYIFPGGYIPALSEVVPHLEQAGLYISDIEILRLHYAETLRHWRERFAANREEARALYDERFCRMWEFYLAGSECSFRHGGMNNVQIQFCKDQSTLPLTRSYIEAEEQRLRRVEDRILPEVALPRAS
jgi:cyclopropane-fatty-acyl-phospholipid synthase